jgi:hypothetical protein
MITTPITQPGMLKKKRRRGYSAMKTSSTISSSWLRVDRAPTRPLASITATHSRPSPTVTSPRNQAIFLRPSRRSISVPKYQNRATAMTSKKPIPTG